MNTQSLPQTPQSFLAGCRWLALLLVLLLPQLTQAQTIRYVNAGASGTGTSWANASGDLQAMTDASAVNDQVWVAAGTYKPTTGTNPFVSFAMKAGVAIYGGFVGNETALDQRPAINPVAGQPSSTTLSGDIGAVGNPSDNSHHVINNSGNNLTNTAMLDGFVITGGNAGNDQVRPGGGALLNQNSSPSIVNCSLSGNLGNDGGAITNTNGSSPTLINCVLQGNSANQRGGAIFNLGNSRPTLTNCSLRGNSANQRGGAIYSQSSSPLLNNCSLQDNVANDLGGAICNEISSPTLTNCSLTNNTASNFGGAIVNIGNSNPTLVNCSLQNNRVGITGGYGGAIYNQESSPRLINCSLQGNSATSFGGAIANRLNSSPSLTNCSLQSNSAPRGGALSNEGGSPSLTNSVVWGNGGVNTIHNDNATLTANYSLFDASVTGYDGTNNLTTTTSPFASTSSVALNACAPAINAGSNDAYSTAGGPATDGAGNARIQANIIDMGAVEFRDTPGSPIAITQQPVSSSTVVVGADVRVSARVSGEVTRFQWYKDGAPVAGQTTPDLRLDNVTSSQAGSYSLVATGACNSVTTTAFSLQVLTPALVSGTKTVAGSFVAGGAITYAIVLTNTGQSTQADNPGNELTDPLPSSVTLTSASASSGSVQTSARTLTWNGSLTSGASVTITIGATINANTSVGQIISNQADIAYDADGNETNEERARSDDPGAGGTADPTSFTIIEPSPPGQPIRYVRAGASGDGRSWTTASGDLQAMINAVGVEQVWVAAGTYKPTTTGPDSRTVSFVMKEGVAIYGGFVGNETALDQRPAINPVAGQPSSTTLSGDIGTVGDNSDNSYQVILNYKNGLTSRAVLDGFVIRGGNANGPDSDPDQDRGGGMYNEEASPSVRNCLFQGNVTQSGYGGGMANLEGSSPRLTNCSFVGNSSLSGGYGGGLANQGGSSPELVDCSFVGNSAGRGGAVIHEGGTSSYISCSFVNNSATAGYGGAVDNVFGAQSSFLNCSFVGNSTNNNEFSEGGAIFTSTFRIRLTDCSFVNNSASRGGALTLSDNRETQIQLTNCSFVGNRATTGGAIYSFSGLRLTNCSFVGNRATTGGAINDRSQFQVQLTNGVLWDNGGDNTFSIRQAEGKPSSLAASYSLFDNTVTGYDGTANRTTITSPFASATDVALTACAPALNTGSNEAYQAAGGPATDLIGNPRIVNSTIDMGAVEFQGTPSQPVGFVQPPTNASACAGSNLSIPLSVSGTGPFSVQLYKAGTPVGSAQSSLTLTLSNLQPADAGRYQVAVTGACTSVTSTAFDVTVNDPIAPTLQASATTITNQPISVTASGCSGGTVNWLVQGGSGQASGLVYTLTQPGNYTLSATCQVGACTSPASPPLVLQILPGGFAITAVSMVGCQLVDQPRGEYRVSFSPQYSGANANPISFAVVNELGPTTSPAPYTLRLYDDNPVITLIANQAGNPEARYRFAWLAACGSGTDPNQPPTTTGIPSQTITQDQPYQLSLAAYFSDPDGQALNYQASGLPPGLSLGGSLISGTPSATGETAVTVTALDPGGLSVSTRFNLTITPRPSTPPSGFTITGVSLVSCEADGPNRRRLVFNPQYSGLSGQPVSFSVVNELSPTTAPGPYTLTLYTDNPAITLRATQQGTAGEASFAYNWLAACTSGAGARRGAEPVVALSVRVLGNPVQNGQVWVEVGGAAGEPLQLSLTDMRGQPIDTHQVERATTVERHHFALGRATGGPLLLRVSTPTQSQTVKVVKAD